MKRLLLTLSLLACFLFSCSPNPQNSFMEENGKIKVLSTTAMIDNLVAAIGCAEIDHVSLIVGDLDPHSYELVKGDDEKFLRANVIFYNGLGLEHGASLKNHLEKHPHAIPLGDTVFEKDQKAFIFVDGQFDPHFWMDVSLFAQAVDPIVETLSALDPTHAPLFQERGSALKEKMLAKDQIFKEEISKIPADKRYLVSSHDAFFYFARRYLAEPGEESWRERFMAPEGLAPDGQLSIYNIQAVSEFLCKNQVEVVFPETNISQDALKKITTICREKGLNVKIAKTPLYGDTMGGKGTGAETYLDMIEHNVKALCSNLSEEERCPNQ